jgi:hypothetical protein
MNEENSHFQMILKLSSTMHDFKINDKNYDVKILSHEMNLLKCLIK